MQQSYLSVYENQTNVRNLFVAFKCGKTGHERVLLKEMLGATAAKVYLGLVDLVGTYGPNGAIHTNYKELSTVTGVPEATVGHIIPTLAEAGYITRRAVNRSYRWGYTLFVTGNSRYDKDPTFSARWYAKRTRAEGAVAAPFPLSDKYLTESVSNPRRWLQKSRKTKSWSSGRLVSGGSSVTVTTPTNLGHRLSLRDRCVWEDPFLYATTTLQQSAMWLKAEDHAGHRHLRMGRDLLWDLPVDAGGTRNFKKRKFSKNYGVMRNNLGGTVCSLSGSSISISTVPTRTKTTNREKTTDRDTHAVRQDLGFSSRKSEDGSMEVLISGRLMRWNPVTRTHGRVVEVAAVDASYQAYLDRKTAAQRRPPRIPVEFDESEMAY